MKTENQYFEGIFGKKIVIIGLCPPPLGGIAIHILRVIRRLKEQKNIVFLVNLNIEAKRSRLGYFWYLLGVLFKRPEIVYYHTLSLRSKPLELAILVVFRGILGYELVLVDHTPRFLYTKGKFYKAILRLLLGYVDRLVLMGDSTFRAYLETLRLTMFAQGERVLSKISIEAPYLPPDFSKKEEIFSKYPQDLKGFLASHENIILINGSAARLFNGVDLYGFDMALELIEHLGAEVGLVIVLGETGDQAYFDKLYSLIKDNKNIYLLLGCKEEIWPLFGHIDLFIRPTCSDAYGISIKEALDMGAKVVASDVCQRPEGTILFKSRDQKDFTNKILFAMRMSNKYTQYASMVANEQP